VEVLRNAERNLLSSVPSDPNHPLSGLVFRAPAISPRRNGVKDFRLRFVAAFVPLCSVSSPLDTVLSYHVKKKSHLFLTDSLFNRHLILFLEGKPTQYFPISRVAPLLTCVQNYILAKLTLS